MAKFCATCGNAMGDSDAVCGNCGTPVSNDSAPVTQNAPYSEYSNTVPTADVISAPSKKSDDLIKKILPAAAAAVAGIVALIIIISIASSSGYKKVISKYIEALLTADSEGVVKYTSTIMNDGEEYDEDYADELDSSLNMFSNFFEVAYGEFKSVKVKVTDVEKLDKDEMEDYLEERTGDDEIDGIKKIVCITAEVTIKGEDDEIEDEEVEFYMSKEKGGWKLVSTDLGSAIFPGLYS